MSIIPVRRDMNVILTDYETYDVAYALVPEKAAFVKYLTTAWIITHTPYILDLTYPEVACQMSDLLSSINVNLSDKAKDQMAIHLANLTLKGNAVYDPYDPTCYVVPETVTFVRNNDVYRFTKGDKLPPLSEYERAINKYAQFLTKDSK